MVGAHPGEAVGSPGCAPLQHPNNLISRSASLHGPWHSCTRILCPELVSAGCSSLHFPGLGGSCACDASPISESGPTRDGFASRTRLHSRTTKPPPVPAPLLALHPRLTAPGMQARQSLPPKATRGHPACHPHPKVLVGTFCPAASSRLFSLARPCPGITCSSADL